MKPDLLFRRQLADERPRHFGSLSVVVVNKKSVAEFFFDLNAFNNSVQRNFVGFANGRVRLKKSKAIVEFNLKSIFPLAITCVLDWLGFSLAKWRFERIQNFHMRLSRCNC